MRQTTQTVKLINTAIRAANTIDGRRTEYRVQDPRGNLLYGLVLHVHPTGRRSFHVHYDIELDGKRRRRKPKIGDGETELDKVKARWRLLHDEITAGHDPVVDYENRLLELEIEKRRSLSFRSLAERWLEVHAKPKKRSWREDQLRLEKYIFPEIGNVPATEVQKQDIIRIVDSIATQGNGGVGAPVSADRARVLISTIYNWASGELDFQSNPAKGISPRSERKVRDRPFSDDEIRTLWFRMEERPNTWSRQRCREAIKLLVLTGQRREQVTAAELTEFELNSSRPKWSIPATRAKNKLPHIVPLTPQMIELIKAIISKSYDSPFLFPIEQLNKPINPGTLSREMKEICFYLNIQDGQIHDLRHTVSTKLSELGVSREIRSHIFSHQSELGGVSEIYNHYDFYREKLQALTKWNEHLFQILDGSIESKIVNMRS